MDSVIVVDKPKDYTSFDVVAIMKGMLHTRKVGHTGTLDPMATGVLPILVGRATKAQDILPDSDKKYSATFKLGITTDTLDITGNILSKNVVNTCRKEIEEVCKSFLGNIEQTPPMYSAIKKNGVRLYTLARKGIEIEREKRKIKIHTIKIIEYDEKNKTLRLDVACSKGTYIRSLGDDIGKELGCGATMTELRRTSACGFDTNSALTLEQIQKYCDNNTIENHMMKIDNLFNEYIKINISDNQTKRFSNGNSLDVSRVNNINDLKQGEIVRVYSSTDEFLGLGQIRENDIRLYKLFKCLDNKKEWVEL